jgi:glycine cleavage system H protein
VYVDLPDPGADEVISKGDTVSGLESVKTAAEVYAPVDGKVVEVN